MPSAMLEFVHGVLDGLTNLQVVKGWERLIEGDVLGIQEWATEGLQVGRVLGANPHPKSNSVDRSIEPARVFAAVPCYPGWCAR